MNIGRAWLAGMTRGLEGVMVTSDDLAYALHLADFDAPCMWRKGPFDKCPMANSHRRQAADLFAQLKKAL